MKVLGISPDVWISSAAIVDGGEVLSAVAEERLNRKKMSAAFPSMAIESCLRDTKLSMKDIDCVVAAWNPGPHIRAASGRHTGPARWRGEYLASFPSMLLNHFGSPAIDRIDEIIEFQGQRVSLRFLDHHLAHAASAFYLSPFSRAAVLTVDGRGENETATWWNASDAGLEKIQSTNLPHSLGLFYSTITEYLGFAPHSDEWKVMALAPFGKAKNEYYPRLRKLINSIANGNFELDLTYFAYYLFDKQPHFYSDKLIELLGPARKKGQAVDQRHYDIAWALQAVFEEVFTHMLVHLHNVSGATQVAIAGGAAMNSVYNGKIREVTPFKEVFIPSCPDDTGVSVGAALYVAAEESKRTKGPSFKHTAQTHNYWGPSYSNEEIRETLERCKVSYRESADLAGEVAELLKAGKLIGWFQGKCEFGQRSLGNRSILADPRLSSTKDKVNAAVKFREGFRPFAPAVLAEEAQNYFEIPKGVQVPFMESVYQVRPEKREGLGAVVHVDGSGRVQTVDRETNAPFYELIAAFKKLTGVPILLNTSFNLNGEPVVCSPTDAIRTFFSCGLDVLVMGDYIVNKGS
jgi:carbamoyltransferase